MKTKNIEYAVKGLGYVELIGGKSEYFNKTKADFMQEGYKILQSIEELEEYYKEYEESKCNKWIEITEEDYIEALEVLPPLEFYKGGFFISEASFGSVHSFYQKYKDKYFTSKQNIYTDRQIILDSLKEFYSNKN